VSERQSPSGLDPRARGRLRRPPLLEPGPQGPDGHPGAGPAGRHPHGSRGGRDRQGAHRPAAQRCHRPRAEGGAHSRERARRVGAGGAEGRQRPHRGGAGRPAEHEPGPRRDLQGRVPGVPDRQPAGRGAARAGPPGPGRGPRLPQRGARGPRGRVAGGGRVQAEGRRGRQRYGGQALRKQGRQRGPRGAAAVRRGGHRRRQPLAAPPGRGRGGAPRNRGPVGRARGGREQAVPLAVVRAEPRHHDGRVPAVGGGGDGPAVQPPGGELRAEPPRRAGVRARNGPQPAAADGHRARQPGVHGPGHPGADRAQRADHPGQRHARRRQRAGPGAARGRPAGAAEDRRGALGRPHHGGRLGAGGLHRRPDRPGRRGADHDRLLPRGGAVRRHRAVAVRAVHAG
ncbi:MAG: Protein translocase subunit SecD, partial [uncultured Gemmatimonadetes bacterium]